MAHYQSVSRSPRGDQITILNKWSLFIMYTLSKPTNRPHGNGSAIDQHNIVVLHNWNGLIFIQIILELPILHRSVSDINFGHLKYLLFFPNNLVKSHLFFLTSKLRTNDLLDRTQHVKSTCSLLSCPHDIRGCWTMISCRKLRYLVGSQSVSGASRSTSSRAIESQRFNHTPKWHLNTGNAKRFAECIL